MFKEHSLLPTTPHIYISFAFCSLQNCDDVEGSVHAALNVCHSTSHCSECDDKSDFSGSKELKDKLISSPILQ